MERSFNTAGPCHPDEHYMLPPERRLDRIMRLIKKGKFFTLLGGRQTGKTTSAQWLAAHYNAGESRRALWIDLQPAREQADPARAFLTVLNAMDQAVKRTLPGLGVPAARASLLDDPATSLLFYLQDLARRSPGPLVVLFDEADGLAGATMVSFLAQLRDGYSARRLTPFPRSVVLIGRREVRDYVSGEHERDAAGWLDSTSPFNITAAPVHLEPFTAPDVEALLAQHTEATGQRFEPAATARVFELTQGHPWLVNALAERIIDEDVLDRDVAVTAEHVEAARDGIILERRTHLESLVHELRDPRVRKIFDPMLVGDETGNDVLDDDLAHVIGLGLVRIRDGRAEIANPIYREVIPRALTYVRQVQIAVEPASFVRPDGSLDLPRVMAGWQTFWREDGHLAAAGLTYREAGPHLLLMAYLQRIVDVGGRIEREYGLGRGALDLMIDWRGARHAIEVKSRRDIQTEERAIARIARHLDAVGLAEGWLVMFDLRSTPSSDQPLMTRTLEVDEKKVHVVEC